jgi:hypothetical protein
MNAHLIRRLFFAPAVFFLALHLYPRMGEFTAQLSQTGWKLLGGIPLTWLHHQWFHGLLLFFCAFWVYQYLEGFSEELALARYRSFPKVLGCAVRWLTAMVMGLVLVLVEPVLMFKALTTWTPLPIWMVWVIAVAFFLLAIGLGLRYPAYIIASVRERIIQERL